MSFDPEFEQNSAYFLSSIEKRKKGRHSRRQIERLEEKFVQANQELQAGSPMEIPYEGGTIPVNQGFLKGMMHTILNIRRK